ATIQVDQRIVTVTNRTTHVTVAKADFTNASTLLAGAKLQLFEGASATGTPVREWLTSTAGETITGLKIDTQYTLHEVYPPKGYKTVPDVTFTIDGQNVVTLVTVDDHAAKTADDAILLKDEKASTPDLVKKIQDTNDSIGAFSLWQDSADYDIGDHVPYKLTATLADNVTDYVKYHITFHDTMDEGLTFDADSVKVTVADKKVEATGYTLNSDTHSFDLTLTWEGVSGARIAEDLNGKPVVVEFTATLNDKAKVGSEGNVNKAKLEYSNNPKLDDSGKPVDETGETPEDGVVAFTYQVVVNKVTQEGAALSGAEFKLEKIKQTGRATVGTYTSVNSGNTFTFTGLDDGTYVLTETKAPKGYLPAAPITFTVTADHNIEWNLGDTSALTSLTGNVVTGEIAMEALTGDAEKGSLTGSVKNAEEPTFEKKVIDANDTTGETSDPQDSADYDIGDDVPFVLTAKLADNVSSYETYSITFHDTLEAGKFGEPKDIVVTLNGEALTAEDVTAAGESFARKVTWSKDKISTALNGATVVLTFKA
ncbi:MAG: isopeptide-forming domain-containing fimbrial protein, partial [Clostridia bacterium]|nr:isopeptide-forming domain-containing fimbrial protein [Clostridia bacterium]